MKTLRLIGFGLLAVLLNFTFVSCDPDPDPEPEPSPDTNPLVGTWVYDEGDWISSFTFNSDGTGVELDYYNGSVEEDKFTYVYNESISTVKITFSDGSYTFRVKFIASNEMEFDGCIYVRTEKINPLVGTWVCDEGDWKHTVTFNSDGTGKNIYLEYYDGTVEKHEENFTYVYNESNSTVKIIFSGDGSETFDVKFISNNKMEYDGSIYVKI